MLTATPPTAATTQVLGFFNKNSFPLSIVSDHIGVNMQVAPKSYVLDRAGRKINDPRLDFYASSGLMSKEFSPTPVPLILLGGTPVAGAGPSTSVVARTTPAPLRTPVQGTITLPGMPNKIPAGAVSPAQPAVSAPGIHAMSVQQATAAGLIPRPDRRDHFARLPNEDKTGEAARSAPSIDSITRTQRPIIPKGLQLQSADTSEVDNLAAEDTVAAQARVPMVAVPPPALPPGDLSVTPAPPPPAPPPVAPRPSVEFDGRHYTTAGNLKKAMMRKFGNDTGMVEEAFEPFRGKFAPQGKKA